MTTTEKLQTHQVGGSAYAGLKIACCFKLIAEARARAPCRGFMDILAMSKLVKRDQPIVIRTSGYACSSPAALWNPRHASHGVSRWQFPEAPSAGKDECNGACHRRICVEQGITGHEDDAAHGCWHCLSNFWHVSMAISCEPFVVRPGQS